MTTKYNINNINETDLLVIGSGIAGCTAALQAADDHKQVMILTSENDPLNSNSYLAQGGIIYKASNEPNEVNLLSSDIQRAGAQRSDKNAVKKLASEGPQVVETFLLGGRTSSYSKNQEPVPFDRTSDGQALSLCLEASHNRPRILHWSDCTGKAIMENLLVAVRNHPNIDLRCNTTAIDLLVEESTHSETSFNNLNPNNQDDESNTEEEEDRSSSSSSSFSSCTGAIILSQNGAIELVKSDNVILATGGCGDVYAHTSNPANARGDGVAMAIRAGAKVKDMEYMQFHPTTLYMPGERSFLLTEALRGEGALLRDPISKELFAKSYHEDGELAPRDVVARMIVSQMRKTNSQFVYLDISHLDEKFLSERFPSIFQHCLARGLNLGQDLIPVVPAAHYTCGGVEVDLNGQTSLPRLYAIGEVSCTGLHGANRLASTSLLEGMVWGAAAAIKATSSPSSSPSSDNEKSKNIVKEMNDSMSAPLNLNEVNEEVKADQVLSYMEKKKNNVILEDEIWLEKSWSKLRHIMWNKVGIVRHPATLKSAVIEISLLTQQAEAAFDVALATAATASFTHRSVPTKYFRKSPESSNGSSDGSASDDDDSKKNDTFTTSTLSSESDYSYHRGGGIMASCVNDDEYWLTKSMDSVLLLEERQTLPYQCCKLGLYDQNDQDKESFHLQWINLLGFQNSCLTALAIAKSALENETSAGAHYIETN